ncbi:MAG: Ig-like domain-containing protein [Anaerolineae bacterium]|nr:Ig-like domain-containing protein [Anaerolineae bacterium]
MRRFLLVAGLVLVLLSVSGLAAQQEAAGDLLQLVDSAPLSGEELGRQESIMLYFDMPVDCDSAQTAITLEPAVSGDVTCDGQVVTFTPSQAYQDATDYTLTVSDAIRGQNGAALAESVELIFSTIDALAVTEVLPADGSVGIESDAVITVIFNRPVVPLTIAEDMADLPAPLTFEPAVEGSGEWLNTSIYVFRPDPALAGGTTYTVTVNTGLAAADGATLAAPYSWSFQTVDPAIVETQPMDQATDVGLDAKISVTFNQPMDQASVESSFYLRPDVEESGSLSGSFEWSEDSTGFRFTPDDGLRIDTLYTAGFDGANTFSAAGSGSALTGFERWSFVTVPLPAIIGTDPSDEAENAYPYGGFTLYFASPMNRDTLRDKITIEPEPWRDFEDYYYDWDNSYNLSFPTEPSTTYTISVAPGMEDVYGNAIQTERIFTYTTAPYDPTVNLQTPGNVGFYNAYNEETQLFLTHRNVSKVDLWLYSVNAQDFVSAVASQSYDPSSSYSPSASDLLRNWTIQSDVPENQQRYELLNLGDVVSNPVSCPGAPASRLKVGDVAVVITEPDALRARETPGDGDIVELLYRDYRLPVVGGPECVDGVLWWQVQLRDESRAWVAEGVVEEYFLDLLVAGQQTAVTVAPAVEGSDGLAPGIYMLQATTPETTSAGYGPQNHFLMVSTANVTVKASIDRVTVWVTDVNSGQPIADAPITIYDSERGQVANGRTDENGLLELDVPRVPDLYTNRVAVLQTDDQFGIGTSDWSDGIEGYQFGQNTNYFPRRYQVYMYTDRPVYRPDQPVYFRGVVREQDDVTYTLPPFDSVPVQITNSDGEIVFDEQVDLTPFGTFSGQFDVDADAGLGFYRINVELPSDSEYNSEGGGVSFTVAEYRVPEFQVEVTANEPEVVQNDTIDVLVDSSYFFGGKVSDANVEYSVRSDPYSFTYEGPGYYDFTDFNYDGGPGEFYAFYGQEVARGEGTTDASGQFTIEIPADLEDATQSAMFTIEAVVRDESGLTVAGRTEVIVHKGLVYIGARPESYVSTAGQEANVEIIAVDWDSEPIANQDIDVEVVERRWSSVQEEDENGRTTWTWEVEEIPVTSGNVTTDDNGNAVYTFTPPNGGIFKVKISTRDSAGNEVISATTLWVSSSEYVSWRQQNSNRIDLIADQQDYNIGDTAEILLTSPFQGETKALVTVERGDVLQTEVVTMDSNSYVYRLPITEDFAPNVFVTVMIVKGVDEDNPVAGFRMGMIQLGVDNQRKEITITATPDREQAGPRETVTYTIETTDYQGEPVQAEVGVGLTDLATLSVGDPNSGPILRYFYGEQGLSVRTGTPLTINTDQITQTVLDTIKGGGGGGGEGGIFDIREEFVDTPYWNPTVVTDENGQATISIMLPDNLTTWRLDARAVSQGEDGTLLVGQDTFDLLSTKPLLIRPVTPRFAVVGDVVQVLAIVNNNTGQDMPVEVSIEGSGFTLQGDLSQTVTIPAGGRQRVIWPLTISDVANLDLTFFANGNDGEFTDASKPPLGLGDDRLLPVYKYEVPETVGTGGILREAGERTEAISLPQRFEVTQGSLEIKLDPSLAATTIDGLNYLENFPHQCIEQTVSRFLPNIITYRALDNLGVADAELEANLDRAVNFALQRLYAQQKANGGWGWFVQDDSNPLTTAYALIGLTEAQDSGFSVDDNVIQGAQQYLQSTFIVPGPDTASWRLNRQAFTLYALARSGAPDVARTTTLYESRARLDYYAKAFLAQTLYFIDPTANSRTDTLLSDLINGAVVSATGTHWEEETQDYWNWNTDTRTTAIALETLVTLRPDSDLIPNVVRWLMVARRADAWETTQETAWAVMALTDWMVTTGELNPAYDYSAAFNGDTLFEGEATPATVKESTELQVAIADMLQDEVNNLVIERGEGPGVLYYTAHLNAYLPVPQVEPLSRGIIVQRRYVDPDTGETITEAQVGDLVQVRLTVIAPNDLHYVVVEDPIPAGSEGVDPNLQTSQQIGTQPELNPADTLSYGWGWWWFSNIEFRDEKVVLYSTYLPAGTYEYVYNIRAGLEGTYNVIPPTGREFYLPEVYGRGAGSVFTILPAAE